MKLQFIFNYSLENLIFLLYCTFWDGSRKKIDGKKIDGKKIDVEMFTENSNKHLS